MAWSPADATENIRRIANDENLTIAYTAHARERMVGRGLIVSDVLHVLKRGFCLCPCTPSTREGFNKYEMSNRTPNSGGRDVCVVVIPQLDPPFLKLVTVMWLDEPETRAGTVIGVDDDNV